MRLKTIISLNLDFSPAQVKLIEIPDEYLMLYAENKNKMKSIQSCFAKGASLAVYF